MEKELRIKTSDGKLIYGTLSVAKKKSKKLIIFVHGFTGHQNEHIFFNGAKFFADKGFDAFRFNLYAGEKKNVRHFRDTTISLHGKDITAVVKSLRKKYEEIYVVGHSYGGTSLLFADQTMVDRFIFWDASYINSSKIEDKNHLKYNKKIGAYVLDWGLEIVVGKKFIDELKNFPDCGELIKKIHKPVVFITAQKGNMKAGKKYYAHAHSPKKLVNINRADHNFNDWSSEQALLKETYDWLK